MTTIKDIAREVGVSPALVSFALNGTAPVAAETKAKILETVERLNYRPNSAARGLVTKRANSICLFVPHPGSDVFNMYGLGPLLQGVGERVDRIGMSVVISWDPLDQTSTTCKALALAQEHAVDGILFMLPKRNPDLIERLNEMQFPFVVLGSADGHSGVHTVDIDNHEAAHQCTRHLIHLGHTRIAFISHGPLDITTMADRFEGYQEALEDVGIKYNGELVYFGSNSEISGYHAMEQFMSLSTRPTAVVAGSSSQSPGVLKYCQTFGITIPDDIALVGFDDSPFAQTQGITTMPADQYLIGRESTKLLLKLITQKGKRSPQSITIPSSLIIRDSCGAKKSDPRIQSKITGARYQ